jgi:hypothetical protein
VKAYKRYDGASHKNRLTNSASNDHHPGSFFLFFPQLSQTILHPAGEYWVYPRSIFSGRSACLLAPLSSHFWIAWLAQNSIAITQVPERNPAACWKASGVWRPPPPEATHQKVMFASN